MLKQKAGWTTLSSQPMLPISSTKNNDSFPVSVALSNISSSSIEAPKLSYNHHEELSTRCKARRRVRYEEEDDDGDEEYGYNEEIAMLELYSQSARDEALLVRALVDNKEEEILIFKGFSSSLTYGTSPDPSKSILPARAVIKFIDRVKGPFNPTNIEYLEKGLSWESFKAVFCPN